MNKELKEFNKRFNIEIKSEEKNIEKFKNSLSKILEKYIGNISLQNDFRDEFIKNTGIAENESCIIDSYTEIDMGQGDWLANPAKNYVKFSDTCIGKAFREDFDNIIKYLQVVFLMKNSIISKTIKEKLYKEINDILDAFDINIFIQKEENKYLILKKGAKELDKALVNDVLEWLEKYPESRKMFVSALEKYQNKGDTRNILDDIRLSLELLVQEKLNNKKSLENNISNIGTLMESKGINKEIANMYVKYLDIYNKYQNNCVKHAEKCNAEELEFIIYQTGTFMRFIISL